MLTGGGDIGGMVESRSSRERGDTVSFLIFEACRERNGSAVAALSLASSASESA
jgi:hypothetical protein